MVSRTCEDGCKSLADAEKRSRLKSIHATEYIIVVLSRAVQTIEGLKMLKNKITPRDVRIRYSFEEFIFCYIPTLIHRDEDGNEAVYQTRAVIEYRGSLSRSGASLGHYTCDVQVDGSWFRTNDDREPERIESYEVSKMGYAFLFQRS